jgi:hypothetical protein
MQKVKQLKAAVWDTHVWVWAAVGDEKTRQLEVICPATGNSAIR